jgi:hypothetical protein
MVQQVEAGNHGLVQAFFFFFKESTCQEVCTEEEVQASYGRPFMAQANIMPLRLSRAQVSSWLEILTSHLAAGDC